VLAGGLRNSTLSHPPGDHPPTTPNFHHVRGRYLVPTIRLTELAHGGGCGLMISCATNDAQAMLARIRDAGCSRASIVGTVEKGPPRIEVASG